MLKIIGFLLIAMGIVDFVGDRFMDFDLWSYIGIQLPNIIWQYSAMIEGGLGLLLTSIGGGGDNE